MRLIDADRLKKEFYKLPIRSNWGEAFLPLLIDEQPTAYDVDKVVNQLEDLIADSVKKFDYGISKAAYTHALEIVERGGKDD